MDIQLPSVLVLSLFAFVGIVILINAIWIVKTEKRLKRFFLGKKGKDLEDTILDLQDEVGRLKTRKVKIETVRFNPFPDQGSNQSFAIGVINEEGDGVVLSSLYSRERMSIFAKPIKSGKSEYELTSEERTALEKAKV